MLTSNINSQLEENIKQAISYSFKNLTKYLSLYHDSFYYKLDTATGISRLPTLKDDFTVHQKALLENIRVLKQKLINSKVSL